jgi:lysophospholipase
VRRFDDYLADVQALVETAIGDRAPVPTFLLGHSMGGLIATRFAQERPSGLRGLLLSSPFFRVKMAVPVLKRAAARVLTHITPWLALAADVDPGDLSRDPEVGRLYMADPLVTHVATTRWFTEAMGAQALAFARAEKIAIPVLIVAGADDKVVDPEAWRELFARLKTPDRTLKVWEGLRHEILNEPEKEQVLGVFIDWIEKHLEAAA